MKRFNFPKIVSLIFVCAMLMGALTIAAFATGSDDNEVVIASNNVYYGDTYQIMYAIKAPEGASISAVDSKGNSVAIVSFTDPDTGSSTVTLDGVEYKTYITKGGVAAQAIDEVITITVSVEGGESATKSYSVLQYIYERRNVKNNVGEDEGRMFDALIAYADAANAFIDKETVSFNDYKYVTVVNGTLDGNNTAGMFVLGATPFENIEANLETGVNQSIAWTVSVDGGEAAEMALADLKTLTVTGNMVITAAVVDIECDHNWSGATCTEAATCTICGAVGEVAEHTWSDWIVVDPTCAVNGSKTRECSVCGEIETETLNATGEHDWTDANCTAPKTCSTCGETEGEALGHTEVVDAAVAPTCTETGLTEGKHCSVCNEVLVAQETVDALGHEIIEATCISYESCVRCDYVGTEYGNHSTENGKCDYCNKNIVVVYQLVTDASQLKAGDMIVIAASDSGYAMSTTQNTNNRGQVAITKNGNTISWDGDVQIITLKTGTTDGTYAFYTGSGYLYAASSGSNHLKTETKLSANSSWLITITDGVASVVAQGTNTRNVMQYNQTSSLFACYASASQKGISIYVKTVVATCAHDELTDVTTVDPTCTVAGSTTGTCTTCGENVVKEIKATGHTEETVPAVDATCAEDGLTAGVVCTVCETTLVEQEVVPATGEHNDGDGNGSCDVCGTDMNTDEAKAQAVLAGLAAPKDNATSDGEGIALDTSNSTGYEATIKWAITGGTNSGSQIDENELVVTLNDNESTIVLTVSVTVGEATATESFTISVAAGKKEPTTLATFEFGTNGSASHADGSEKSTYSETNNGYTLEFDVTKFNMSKVYFGARDAKGNSCIKLGTSSNPGSFTFTVGDDVTSVVIYVAKYKANTTKITVNGTSYTISGASNDGVYDAITVDTTTTKTVSFTTVSGGVRCMINAIEFIG